MTQPITLYGQLARIEISRSDVQVQDRSIEERMAIDTAEYRRLAFNLISLIATPIALFYAASWLFETLDPLKTRNDAAKKQSAKAIQRLRKSLKDADVRLKDITEHETVIMAEVITPEELNVKFGGNEDTKMFLNYRYWGIRGHHFKCERDSDISIGISGPLSICFVISLCLCA